MSVNHKTFLQTNKHTELRCFRVSLYALMAHLQQPEDQNSESSKTVNITNLEQWEFKPHHRLKISIFPRQLPIPYLQILDLTQISWRYYRWLKRQHLLWKILNFTCYLCSVFDCSQFSQLLCTTNDELHQDDELHRHTHKVVCGLTKTVWDHSKRTTDTDN